MRKNRGFSKDGDKQSIRPKFYNDEYQEINRMAIIDGMTMSLFVRNIVLEYINDDSICNMYNQRMLKHIQVEGWFDRPRLVVDEYMKTVKENMVYKDIISDEQDNERRIRQREMYSKYYEQNKERIRQYNKEYRDKIKRKEDGEV